MAEPKKQFTPEFRAEAVRLTQTSGRSHREIAADLGVGRSTLRNWIDSQRDREMDALPSDRQGDMVAELKRLRRENEVLRQEREILKRATAFFAKEGKSMRFELIDEAKRDFPVQRLCKVLAVSPSGYFAWKNRPASRRQREDLVLLAHVRAAFSRSHETYGSPRMTHELREQGLEAGRRRVARLMRENGLKARQPRRYPAYDRQPICFPVAPNRLDQDFTAAGANEKWGVDLSYI